MSTFLFDSIIFGPVWSRRLGESLGVNLLPLNRKTCTFNCIYCECGLTPSRAGGKFPPLSDVVDQLYDKLFIMKEEGQYLNSITFAGNGEPTMHPEFADIMDESIKLRNKFYPDVKVAVLSNATNTGDKKVFKALGKADMNILKLDSAVEETINIINCPRVKVNIDELINRLTLFKGEVIIQTLFFKAFYKGMLIDNTSDAEIEAWLQALQKIKPSGVMIYSLARDTAIGGLEAASPEVLTEIALRAEKAGINTQVNP